MSDKTWRRRAVAGGAVLAIGALTLAACSAPGGGNNDAEAPDVVERAVLGAKVPNVEGDAMRVSAVIRPRDFSEEPACAVKYVPSTVPGMF